MDGPTVCCVFGNRERLGVAEDVLVRALQEYVDRYVGPRWGVGCRLVAGDAPQPGQVPMYWLDNADQAGVLGYHVFDGTAKLFVFVKTAKLAGQEPSEVGGHELAEALADLYCDRVVQSPRGRLVGLENADGVEGPGFEVGGVLMPNFVLPAWFGQPNPAGVEGYDHLGTCSEPWEILPGGYMPVWDGSDWTQIFGSLAAMEQFHAADQRLRRSHRRARPMARRSGSAVPRFHQNVRV